MPATAACTMTLGKKAAILYCCKGSHPSNTPTTERAFIRATNIQHYSASGMCKDWSAHEQQTTTCSKLQRHAPSRYSCPAEQLASGAPSGTTTFCGLVRLAPYAAESERQHRGAGCRRSDRKSTRRSRGAHASCCCFASDIAISVKHHLHAGAGALDNLITPMKTTAR